MLLVFFTAYIKHSKLHLIKSQEDEVSKYLITIFAFVKINDMKYATNRTIFFCMDIFSHISVELIFLTVVLLISAVVRRLAWVELCHHNLFGAKTGGRIETKEKTGNSFFCLFL